MQVNASKRYSVLDIEIFILEEILDVAQIWFWQLSLREQKIQNLHQYRIYTCIN